MNYIQYIAFLSVVIGLLVGVIGTIFITYRKVDAIMHIDISDPEKDKYNLMILCPLEELHKRKYLIVEVKETK